jgi:hypothetical protein
LNIYANGHVRAGKGGHSLYHDQRDERPIHKCSGRPAGLPIATISILSGRGTKLRRVQFDPDDERGACPISVNLKVFS